jgi:hypothetical protein
MKTRLSIVMLIVAVLVVCFAVTQVMAGEKEEGNKNEAKLTIDQVPAAVAATLQQVAGNGTIDEIEQKDNNGVVTFSADITKDGKKLEAKVAADGTLIKTEEDKPGKECKKEGKCHKGHKDEGKEADGVKVTLADLPPAVAATLQQAVGNGTVDEIEKEDEAGVVTYSADVTIDGKKLDVKIAADGKLIKTEEDKPGKEGKEADEKD